jgi:hypothetical protein
MPLSRPEHTITQRGIHSLLAKEALRVYPAGPLLERIAVQDTVIPVINPIATSTGEYIAQIPVQKGQLVTLDVACYQRLVAPLVDKSGSIYVYA